jgi:hypothetical protein
MLPGNRHRDFANGPFVVPTVVFVISVAGAAGNEVTQRRTYPVEHSQNEIGGTAHTPAFRSCSRRLPFAAEREKA